MTNQFHKLLNKLHMVVIQPGHAELNDRLLCEAVTLNEHLQSLGYMLKPDDLVRLAGFPPATFLPGPWKIPLCWRQTCWLL